MRAKQISMSTEELQNIKNRFGIIGNADLLNRAIERAYMVAPTDYSVLITGESGTGKEFFPKIIHQFSARKHAQYIAINCGAIPNGTIDSELFGHIKGAFTGAVNDHKGYFEEANGGTIFLDEVGELPLETQVRLLRVLEQGEFIRVGSSTPQKTNVRVVAATNVNLQDAIARGRFREDLYYRLSTINIEVPALRERREDIPILFRKFASDCTDRYRMPAIRLSEDAQLMLQNYYWRGNIRQLKNVAEQICVIEQRRDITSTLLRQYLPAEEQSRAVAKFGEPQNADYQTERELLYKVIFEMKQQLDSLTERVNNITNAAITLPHSGEPVGSDSDNKTTLTITKHAEGHHNEMQKQVLISQRPNDLNTQHDDKINEWQAAEVVEEGNATQSATPLTIEDIEKESIRQSLQRNNGSRKLTSQELKIPERTLYRKIKEYGL